jgi:hypothetical protein
MATRFIMVSRDAVVKHRRKQQQDIRARLRYETKKPNRSHHNHDNERKHREDSWHTKPFIMWDGEGPTDAGYALFGSSAGDELCKPHLGTVECLQLILDRATETNAIHFWFGGNYDVSMILHELPHRYLRALHNFTRTVWNGWELEHVPHKWFRIKHGHESCTIYDVRSFFAGNYQSALEDFGIGSKSELAQIHEGKSNRSSFVWAEISEIREYWRLELKLGPLLMEALRTAFYDAGYVPRSWHGPGALARMALKRHKVYDAMAECPPDVRIAAQYAFAGGRFELFQAGHIQGRVYNADIRSAYPFFATQLPNLARGKWRFTRNYEPGRFGIYHIRYDARPQSNRAFPLFRRLPNGCVVWPHRTEGWYWNPEASLVADDKDALFIEGWVFDELDSTDRPFAWLADYYARRQRLKGMDNAAEYTFKLIINSVYGQLAQRAGWDRKSRSAPKSHQLEWAGYITSACRATVYRASRGCGEKLVSIDTDGIYSLSPIPDLDCGKLLGQWDTEEYTDGVFWQSGIYGLKHDTHKDKCPENCDGWGKARSRGISKRSYNINSLLHCVYNNKSLELSRHMFITYGLADIHGWHLHNTWIDEPHSYEMGGGKRIHFKRACKTHCNPPVHRLAQWEPTYGVHPDDNGWSHKHKLPWLDPPDDNHHINREVELFNANHLDSDDEWVLHYP